MKAKLVHDVDIAQKSFVGILVPKNGEKGHGIIELRYVGDSRIKKTATVVASFCEGTEGDTTFGDANYQIYNVVPADEELLIRGNINYGADLHYRIHILVYNKV